MATPLRPIVLFLDEEEDSFRVCDTPATVAAQVTPASYPKRLVSSSSPLVDGSKKPAASQVLVLDSSDSDDDMPIFVCKGKKATATIAAPPPPRPAGCAQTVMMPDEDENSNSRPLAFYSSGSDPMGDREHRATRSDDEGTGGHGDVQQVGSKRCRSEAMGRNEEEEDLQVCEVVTNEAGIFSDEGGVPDPEVRLVSKGARVDVVQQLFTPTNSQMIAFQTAETPLCLPTMDSREVTDAFQVGGPQINLMGSAGLGAPSSESSSSSPPSTPVVNTITSAAAKPTSNLTQTHLDFGQRSIGATTCPKCGMLYNRCEEDVKLHRKYCSKLAKSEKGRASAAGGASGEKYDDAVSIDGKIFNAALKLLGTPGKPMAPAASATVERKDYTVFLMPPLATLVQKAPALTLVKDENPFADIAINYPSSQLAIAVTGVGKDSTKIDVAFVMAFTLNKRTHEPMLAIDTDQPPPRRPMFADADEPELAYRLAVRKYQEHLSVVERTTNIDINYCHLFGKVVADSVRKMPLNFFQPKACRPTPERERRNQVGKGLFELCLRVVRENAVYGVHLHESAVAFSNALQSLSLRCYSPELANAINSYYNNKFQAAAEASREFFTARRSSEEDEESAAGPLQALPTAGGGAFIYKSSKYHKGVPLLFEADESALKYNLLKVREIYS